MLLQMEIPSLLLIIFGRFKGGKDRKQASPFPSLPRRQILTLRRKILEDFAQIIEGGSRVAQYWRTMEVGGPGEQVSG